MSQNSHNSEDKPPLCPPYALTWVHPHADVRHTPGAQYATDGDYVYERIMVPKAATNIAACIGRKSRSVLTGSIWEPIDEIGEPSKAKL
jgi:hypothetical protein